MFSYGSILFCFYPIRASPLFLDDNTVPTHLSPRYHHTDDHRPHPLQTRRATSTFGKLSSIFKKSRFISKNPSTEFQWSIEAPTPFSKIRGLFRKTPRPESRRGTSRSKRQMNPETDGCKRTRKAVMNPRTS